jgi:predicted PurR-regulated permease PerM
MKNILKALFFMYICNVLIDILEKIKMDEDWKRTISVSLFLMSSGYFCLMILFMIM